MTNPKTTNTKAERPIVYIRSVDVASLPSEIRAQAGTREQLYAIGTEEGTQLALVKDRALAFVVARQNDLTPVSVH